jgi:hypothetical protein
MTRDLLAPPNVITASTPVAVRVNDICRVSDWDLPRGLMRKHVMKRPVCMLMTHQSIVLFSQNKPVTSNQSVVFFVGDSPRGPFNNREIPT